MNPRACVLSVALLALSCGGAGEQTGKRAGEKSPDGGTQENGQAGNPGDAGVPAAGGASAGNVGGAGGSAGEEEQAVDGGSAGSAEVEMELREVPYTALALASARLHTCVLLDDHQVKCFGNNFVGQLGTGDLESRPYYDGLADEPVLDLGTGRSVLSISAGRYTTCAILDDHSVKCWGYAGTIPGASGSLGDEPGEMGDALPTLDLGDGRSAVQVSLAEDFAATLLDDGTVRSWSTAFHPDLKVAEGTVAEVAAGRGPIAFRLTDGRVGIFSGPLASVGSSRGVSFAGDSMTRLCARFDNGLVHCSVNGGEWQLAWLPPNKGLGLLNLQASGCVIAEDDTVRCVNQLEGSPYWAEPGAVEDEFDLLTVRLGGKAVALGSGGDGYACAVMDDGAVKCWGGRSDLIPQQASGVLPALDLGTHMAWVPVEAEP